MASYDESDSLEDAGVEATLVEAALGEARLLASNAAARVVSVPLPPLHLMEV